MLVAAYIAAYKGHKEDLKDEFQNSRHENFQDTKKLYGIAKGCYKYISSIADGHKILVTKIGTQNFGHTFWSQSFGHKILVTKV